MEDASIIKVIPISGFIRRTIACCLLASFGLMSTLPQYALAQILPTAPGLVDLSPAFTPAIMRGISIHPDNPLQFDFIMDAGDSGLTGDALKKESERLIRYFLASVTLPEDDLWVNLSPYEKDRIVPDLLGSTEMGRDMLAQDYLLKQISASLTNPDSGLGKAFWSRIYAKVYDTYGTTDVPVDTFNKVWIMPAHSEVYTSGNNAFVVDGRLKVMLESDYKAAVATKTAEPEAGIDSTQQMTRDIIREICIPALEKEVNEGKNFAPLRQIYHALILAYWYKTNLRESILNKAYADQHKVKGIDLANKADTQMIFDRYVSSFKQGVMNMVREEADPYTREMIPRKYFSGGETLLIKPGFKKTKSMSAGLFVYRLLRNAPIVLFSVVLSMIVKPETSYAIKSNININIQIDRENLIFADKNTLNLKDLKNEEVPKEGDPPGIADGLTDFLNNLSYDGIDRLLDQDWFMEIPGAEEAIRMIYEHLLDKRYFDVILLSADKLNLYEWGKQLVAMAKKSNPEPVSLSSEDLNFFADNYLKTPTRLLTEEENNVKKLLEFSDSIKDVNKLNQVLDHMLDNLPVKIDLKDNDNPPLEDEIILKYVSLFKSRPGASAKLNTIVQRMLLHDPLLVADQINNLKEFPWFSTVLLSAAGNCNKTSLRFVLDHLEDFKALKYEGLQKIINDKINLAAIQEPLAIMQNAPALSLYYPQDAERVIAIAKAQISHIPPGTILEFNSALADYYPWTEEKALEGMKYLLEHDAKTLIEDSKALYKISPKALGETYYNLITTNPADSYLVYEYSNIIHDALMAFAGNDSEKNKIIINYETTMAYFVQHNTSTEIFLLMDDIIKGKSLADAAKDCRNDTVLYKNIKRIYENPEHAGKNAIEQWLTRYFKQTAIDPDELAGFIRPGASEGFYYGIMNGFLKLLTKENLSPEEKVKYGKLYQENFKKALSYMTFEPGVNSPEVMNFVYRAIELTATQLDEVRRVSNDITQKYNCAPQKILFYLSMPQVVAPLVNVYKTSKTDISFAFLTAASMAEGYIGYAKGLIGGKFDATASFEGYMGLCTFGTIVHQLYKKQWLPFDWHGFSRSMNGVKGRYFEKYVSHGFYENFANGYFFSSEDMLIAFVAMLKDAESGFNDVVRKSNNALNTLEQKRAYTYFIYTHGHGGKYNPNLKSLEKNSKRPMTTAKLIEIIFEKELKEITKSKSDNSSPGSNTQTENESPADNNSPVEGDQSLTQTDSAQQFILNQTHISILQYKYAGGQSDNKVNYFKARILPDIHAIFAQNSVFQDQLSMIYQALIQQADRAPYVFEQLVSSLYEAMQNKSFVVADDPNEWLSEIIQNMSMVGQESYNITKETGGIDFNAGNMNMTTKGSAAAFNLPVNIPSEKIIEAQGFVAVITGCSPVRNLKTLLNMPVSFNN